MKWFKRVNKEDKSAIYPELIWDAMPKSGASQVHTHFQASVGLIGYYGAMRRWLDASSQYFNENHRSFMQDFILIHKAFGLVFEFEDVFAIVNLVRENKFLESNENFQKILIFLILNFKDSSQRTRIDDNCGGHGKRSNQLWNHCSPCGANICGQI